MILSHSITALRGDHTSLLARDEARRIAASVAKLPELLQQGLIAKFRLDSSDFSFY
jgi:hypothetical protein